MSNEQDDSKNEGGKRAINIDELTRAAKSAREDVGAISQFQEELEKHHKASQITSEFSALHTQGIQGAAEMAKSIMDSRSELQGILDDARRPLTSRPPFSQMPDLVNIGAERHDEVVSSLKAQVDYLEKSFELNQRQFEKQMIAEEESRKRDKVNRNIAIMTLLVAIAAVVAPFIFNRDIEKNDFSQPMMYESEENENQGEVEGIIKINSTSVPKKDNKSNDKDNEGASILTPTKEGEQ